MIDYCGVSNAYELQGEKLVTPDCGETYVVPQNTSTVSQSRYNLYGFAKQWNLKLGSIFSKEFTEMLVFSVLFSSVITFTAASIAAQISLQREIFVSTEFLLVVEAGVSLTTALWIPYLLYISSRFGLLLLANFAKSDYLTLDKDVIEN